MKFTLKDYQDEAVADVLDRLKKARRRWREERDKHAFSLTATTGAGKTVMAAAVFEALLFGNEDYSFEADPGAVVIWFSDDPSLNTQSMWRLQEASDKLTTAHLVSVENTFQRRKLEAGKIYFLNTQKLSRNSLLVRGHEIPSDNTTAMSLLPDHRHTTLWDTIQNTIEDPALTLYLVLDEAHRGMREVGRSAADGRQTIVKQLINGAGQASGIPVVWGISATVERFNEAIEDMKGHSRMPPVIVDAKKVQDSGLLKDTINLDIPDEVGDFATVLVRRGTDKLREISEAWANYRLTENLGEAVKPLMVLQVPNSPDHNEIGRWLDTIYERWPELPRGSVANVFGEHREEKFGSWSAPYVEPERVQESDWVRVLIAKDAISTGWDCPRAEVMVSFRAASDRTHITQLLGRMLRTPLARRIPGNERLNAVDCLLPNFDRRSVEAVVSALMAGKESTEESTGRRVLVNPIELRPNAAVEDEVWQALLALPSQTLPRKQPRPVRRLTLLAHELAADGILADAGKQAHGELHKVLDAQRVRYEAEITKARQAVLTVEGKTVRADIMTNAMSLDDFVEIADFKVLEDAYRRSAKSISPALAFTYSEYLASLMDGKVEVDEALIEAHTVVAALGLVPEIKENLEIEAERLSTKWLVDFRVAIKGLGEDRQEVYRQIRDMSAKPQTASIARPSLWLQASTYIDAGGIEVSFPKHTKHLMSDAEGLYPVALNSWERHVVDVELGRSDTLAWYRNPSRSSQDSLAIVYLDGNAPKLIRPDFIFFARSSSGKVVTDIVDPHGVHLGDALAKLRGLSAFAAENTKLVRRVEAVALIKDAYRALDLTEQSVRRAVEGATSATDLFTSELATPYRA